MRIGSADVLVQVKTGLGRRGRKPASESRAAEIRQRLAEWKQTPEPQRVSLRVLARELGTSHQLLSHYLQRWEKWQAKEYWRQANEIRTRAEAEHRSMTAWEEQQAYACDYAAMQWTLRSALREGLRRLLRRLERDASAGRLTTGQVKLLRLLASRGYRKAGKILEKSCGANHGKKFASDSSLTALSPLETQGRIWQLR